MKIRKCRGLGSIIEAAFEKIASMSVYVDGFRPPEDKDNLLDLCHYLFRHVINEEFPKFSQQEQELWREGYGSLENIGPDGGDAFAKQGILNFYTNGLTPQRAEQLLPLMVKSLQEIGVKVGPLKADKWKEPYFNKQPSDKNEIRVYRIPILANPNDSSTQDRPPELNMSNSNAGHIFTTVLKYPEGTTSFDVEELMKRLSYYLGEQALPENYNPNPMMKMISQEEYDAQDDWQKSPKILGLPVRPFDPTQDKSTPMQDMFQKLFDNGTFKSGYETADVKDRLMIIQQICQWALNRGYKGIYIA